MRVRLMICSIFLWEAFLFSLPARAEIQTLTVSELSPGMRGIGRTVIMGTEISEFNCEIIDIFKDMGFNGGPLILVRISGSSVTESGGVAGGYSGSPVFIDGKLIGAISWGPYFTQGDVVGVTPINEMLKVFTYGRGSVAKFRSPAKLRKPLTVGGHTWERVVLARDSREASELAKVEGADALVMVPLRTPLIVGGLSQAGFEKLREFVSERIPYVDVIQGSGGGSGRGVPLFLGPTELEPGSSIGVQIASGDLDLTAIGTLTWVSDDGRFLAFGHPFLGDGVTDLPFVTSRILYTMRALDRSYKMGEPIEVVGTVTQDRLTAVGGYLRQVPKMVNCRLEVVDLDLGRKRRYEYSVVNKEQWLSFFAWLIPMEGITYAVDRMGPGTVKVKFSIRGEGLAEPIERENIMYSAYGVSSDALSEFMEALNMVTAMNNFREVCVTNVEIRIEVSSDRRTMDIVRARYQNAPNMGPGAIGYTGPQQPSSGETQPSNLPQEGEYKYENIEIYGPQEPPFPPSELTPPPLSPESGTIGGMVSAPVELVKYSPGDVIKIQLTLRPYRQDEIQKTVELKIPEDFPLGQTTLEVFGGSNYYSAYGLQSDSSDGGGYVANMYSLVKTLDDLIESFLKRPRYNSVIVRLNRQYNQDPYYYLQEDFKFPEEVSTVVEMGDNVVLGYYSLPIEIVSKENSPQ